MDKASSFGIKTEGNLRAGNPASVPSSRKAGVIVQIQTPQDLKVAGGVEISNRDLSFEGIHQGFRHGVTRVMFFGPLQHTTLTRGKTA
jgi:hypothetical protein